MALRKLAPLAADAPWTRAEARHLLNRAGFGVPHQAVDKLAGMGHVAAVATLVEFDQFPDRLTEPDWLSQLGVEQETRDQLRDATPEEREKAINEIQRRKREDLDKLKTWWLDQMRTTPRPLQEKMTLFWHGHFATSAEKVKEPLHNYGLNKVFREHGTGSFKDLVFEVGKTPAMLIYLDNRQNKKGKPNENWARELMELFTLGIGHYTEDDIREAARAFSGYTVVRDEFVFVAKDHDYTEKTFMGRTGKFDGADIINIILEQPQAARFISRKLWEFFVYEDPSDEIVDELAAVMREGDYELKPVLRTIFRSREFYSAKAREGLVKSPAQFLVGVQEDLRIEEPRRAIVSLAMRGLGQDLFFPPNVKGWEGNRTWINTNTILLRYNIPAYLASGQRPNFEREMRLDSMAGSEDGGMMMDQMAPTAIVQQQQQERRRDLQEKVAERKRDVRDVVERKRAEARAKAAAEKKRAEQRRGGAPRIPVQQVLQPWIGKPAIQAVTGLADRHLTHPLDRTQLTLLAKALGDGNERAPLTEELIAVTGSDFLHLLFSTAEYQLC